MGKSPFFAWDRFCVVLYNCLWLVLSTCAFFATAGTIDAAYQLQKNKTIDTSEEELYDCVQSDISNALCDGQHIADSNWAYFWLNCKKK